MEQEKKKIEHLKVKIFIVVFVVLSLFFLRQENQDKFVSLFNSFRKGNKELELVNSVDISGVIDVKCYDDNVVLWQPNKISFLDMVKDIIVEKDFNFKDPFISYGEKNIYVGDKSTGDIYIMDTQGNTVSKKQIKKKVLNIEEMENAIINHIKDKNGEKINIYDKNDKLVGDYLFNEDSVINYSVSNNNKKTLIAVLDLSENKLKSKIYFYDKKGKELNSLDIKGEVVIYSKFEGNNSIILTDKSLYYVKDGKIMWQKGFSLIKDIYVDSNIHILYSNYLETIDFEGRTTDKASFSEKYEKISAFNDDTLVYGNKNVTIVNGGRQILNYEDDIIKADSNKEEVIILKQGKLDIYNVVNKK